MSNASHKWIPEDFKAFEGFDCAPGLRLAAHERVAAIHHAALCARLDRLEDMLERLEKRLWLAVYGVVAVVLATGAQSLMTITP